MRSDNKDWATLINGLQAYVNTTLLSKLAPYILGKISEYMRLANGDTIKVNDR